MENASQAAVLPLVLTNTDGETIKIIVRRGDGYVDATLLCQAMNTQWKLYYKTQHNKAYLATLAKYETMDVESPPVPNGNCRSKCLVELGKSRLNHTWIHPDVAM